MPKDFLKSYPDYKTNYTIYMGRVNFMNIWFAKLDEEECEVCFALKNSAVHEPPFINNKRKPCSDYANHLEKAKISRDMEKL